MARQRVSITSLLIGGLTALPAIAQQSNGAPWGHGHWDGPWHGWFMGPIMMLAFLVVIVVVAVLVVRAVSAPHSSSRRGGSDNAPLDILKERFARGEIDKDEFEQRRKVLGD